MIIWKGLGFLIAIIGLGALIGTEIVVEKITADENFYQDNSWVIFLGMLAAAALTQFLNKSILSSKSRLVIDKDSGEEINLIKSHSLFFIESKWWPIVFVCIGLIAAVFG